MMQVVIRLVVKAKTHKVTKVKVPVKNKFKN